jgi:hypothetical protein
LKLQLLLLLPILQSSCGQKEDYWDKLTPAERAAIQAREQTKCQTGIAKAFNNYLDKSASVLTSDAYKRGKGFVWTLENDQGGKDTLELRVWKQGPDAIYFYVTSTAGSSTATNYFLRLPFNQNADIINDLQSDYCTYANYEGSISDNGPLVITYSYKKYITDGTEEYTDRYSLNFNQLAYFGKFYLTRTVIQKNTKGIQTKKSKITSTFKSKTYDSGFSSSNYLDYEQVFCELEVPTGARYRFMQGGAGFKLASCMSTPVGWSP